MSRLTLILLVLAAVATVTYSARIPRDTEENSTEEVVTEIVEVELEDEVTKSTEVKTEGKSEKKDTDKTKSVGYTSKFDNIDVDQILKSDRLVNNYFKCLMEKGPCTPDGAELRRVLPDALENDCSKCSEKQKNGAERVLEHIIKNKPTQWKELQAKYDPENKYKSKYTEFKKSHNIEE